MAGPGGQEGGLLLKPSQVSLITLSSECPMTTSCLGDLLYQGSHMLTMSHMQPPHTRNLGQRTEFSTYLIVSVQIVTCDLRRLFNSVTVNTFSSFDRFVNVTL